MSGSAAGGVGVLIGVAVAAPVVLAAGCAYGLAKTAQFLVTSTDAAWESHERIQEIRRQEAQLAADRHAVFRDAQSAYERVRALIAADKAAGGSLEVPEAAPDVAVGAELAEIQEVTAYLTVRTAELTRERDAAATILMARKTAEALQFTSTTEARHVDEDLARRAAELVAERNAALESDERGRQDDIAAAFAEMMAKSLERADTHARKHIKSVLLDLPADLDAELAADLEMWLQRLPSLSGSELDTAVYALDGLARDARARSHDRSLHAAIASGIISALAGCTTPVAAEISGRAAAYLDGREQWDPELILKARAELERVERQFCDLTAAAVLATALEELGYDVGESFRTEATRGSGLAHHRDWPDHAVRVDVSAGDGRIALSTVRVGAPAASMADVQKDVEAERQLCHDLDRIVEAAQGHGVALTFPFREEPGEAPVPLVERAKEL